MRWWFAAAERIVVVTENRDHSATQTTVVLGVSRSSAPPRPALVPTVLPGPKTVRLSRARRSGLRVRFTAPAGARRAVVRAFRLVRGGRRLVGSAGATVHAGRATVALRSAAFRRHMVAGTYVLELVLRGAGGAAGRRGHDAGAGGALSGPHAVTSVHIVVAFAS